MHPSVLGKEKNNNMKFKEVVQQIKTLKIQGAEGIAREGVHSLFLVLKESHAVTREALIAELYHAREQLIAARPTEPCLRNALGYVFENIYSYEEDHNLSQGISQRIYDVLRFFDTARGKIVKLGAAKIRHHSVIYTHCHSSTVVVACQEAKKEEKDFIVYNTETRPLYQGRKTAQELAAAGIPVKHFVDSAAGIAMQDAHICLLGSDAMTPYFIYNKVGSGIFAELLATRRIPLYICSNSWKFDPFATKKHPEQIEQRAPEEVWKDAPRGVLVEDPAFEGIRMEYVTAIISELGTLSPRAFLTAVKKTYPWMFRKRG